MHTLDLNHLKQWLKHSENPVAYRIFRTLKAIRGMSFPAPRIITTPFYYAYCSTHTLLTTMTRIFWWTPLFKGRLEQAGTNLYLYGGLPYISGPVEIELGNNCRISGHSTFSGRSCATKPPRLSIGDNVDIGWMTTVAVGRNVIIGNNVRIAGRALLAGYPGHPLDAKSRAAGLPETDDQVGDIVLEDDVWLATGVSVMSGVCIGNGTIVAAGSVVTHDLPANSLCGGIPAKVIHLLDTATNEVKTDITGGK